MPSIGQGPGGSGEVDFSRLDHDMEKLKQANKAGTPSAGSRTVPGPGGARLPVDEKHSVPVSKHAKKDLHQPSDAIMPDNVSSNPHKVASEVSKEGEIWDMIREMETPAPQSKLTDEMIDAMFASASAVPELEPDVGDIQAGLKELDDILGKMQGQKPVEHVEGSIADTLSQIAKGGKQREDVSEDDDVDAQLQGLLGPQPDVSEEKVDAQLKELLEQPTVESKDDKSASKELHKSESRLGGITRKFTEFTAEQLSSLKKTKIGKQLKDFKTCLQYVCVRNEHKMEKLLGKKESKMEKMLENTPEMKGLRAEADNMSAFSSETTVARLANVGKAFNSKLDKLQKLHATFNKFGLTAPLLGKVIASLDHSKYEMVYAPRKDQIIADFIILGDADSFNAINNEKNPDQDSDTRLVVNLQNAHDAVRSNSSTPEDRAYLTNLAFSSDSPPPLGSQTALKIIIMEGQRGQKWALEALNNAAESGKVDKASIESIENTLENNELMRGAKAGDKESMNKLRAKMNAGDPDIITALGSEGTTWAVDMLLEYEVAPDAPGQGDLVKDSVRKGIEGLYQIAVRADDQISSRNSERDQVRRYLANVERFEEPMTSMEKYAKTTAKKEMALYGLNNLITMDWKKAP